MSNSYIEQRVIEEGAYILKNKCTIRQCARVFGVSKSCVHLDVSDKLKKIDYGLYKDVQKILIYNFSVKHLRGGDVVKAKYKNAKKNK